MGVAPPRIEKRTLRAEIDLYPVFDSEAFYHLQALGHLFASSRRRV
jgi:hypothetical protein